MKSNYYMLMLLVLLGTAQFAKAQTKKEQAYQKGLEAIKLMDAGKLDESIQLLEAAQKLDPGRFDYPYELAYAYYAKEDYKTAIQILEKQKKHPDATDKLYQLIGNAYDVLGNTEKSMQAYDEGLKKFPNSGLIYLEKGNVFWGKKEYDKALPFYEKGIEVEPTLPSNYYRATRIYLSSNEEVWGMLYGEIFMNLERNSKRTAEISKLLFDTYKSEINIENDTSTSVSFSKNATINVSDIKDPSKIRLPFGTGVYEMNLMFSLISVKQINLESLNTIRSKFIENYYTNGFNKTYPNILFDYQKSIQSAGHLEAYNHWILMKGDEDAFKKWVSENKEKWDAFVTWFTDNKLKLSSTHRFYSGQY